MKAAPLAGAAGLGAAALALQWAGHGALAPPPVFEPSQWSGWLEGRDPIVAAFSLLRVAALVGLWYVVAVTAVGGLLRVAGAASLVRVADRFTIGPVRRMLAGSVSLGLAASGVVAVGAPALRAPVVAAQTSTTSTTQPPPATVTMHRLGPAEPIDPGHLVVTPVPEVTQATARADRWAVKPGECFWSIAESVLTERSGRSPSDAEIVPFWQRIIEANRLELAERGNPDLIFPGQVFTVPSP
jgi:hypothetical protein